MLNKTAVREVMDKLKDGGVEKVGIVSQPPTR